MLLDVLEILGEGISQALEHAAIDLAVRGQTVVDLADVGHADHVVHGHLAGSGLYRDLGHVDDVHEDHKRLAKAGFGVAGHARHGIDTVEPGRLAGGLHFGVGHKGSVGLFGRSQKRLAGRADGAAHHHLGARAAGRAGRRLLGRVGPAETDRSSR